MRKKWYIPPHQNASFVYHMEDILEVYSRPYDSKRPVVCMDEQPIQLLEESRPTTHQVERCNYTEKQNHEYVRYGTCCIFIFTEPLGGWRKVIVSQMRQKTDWVTHIKHLVDEVYRDAEKTVLVCDKINTHNFYSLYEAFPPAEARRICEGLDMAEIELSAFIRQCLNRRIGSIKELKTVPKHGI